MSYIDDLTYRVIIDTQTTYPTRKTLKFAGFTIVDDPRNDQTIITGNTYGDGYVPDLETVCGVGNNAYSKIENLYDPVNDLDAVNLRTLRSYLDDLDLYEVLTNGNFSNGKHINLSGGSYLYASDSAFVGINDQLNMYNHKIINVATPTDGTDAVNVDYLDNITLAFVLSNGNSANTSIDMNNNKITDLALCTNDQDAANKWYVDSKFINPVSYTAGAGMTQSGTPAYGYTFNIIAGDASITVNENEIHLNYSTDLPIADAPTADYGTDYNPARIDHRHPADAIWHAACRVACVDNVNLSTPGAIHRGLTLSGTSRLLLLNQDTITENGIYVWTGAGTPLTRATDWSGTVDCSVPHCVPCLYASDTQDVDSDHYNYINRGGLWITTTAAVITVGTDVAVGRLLGPEKNVIHEPCLCATTRNISMDETFGILESDYDAFDTTDDLIVGARYFFTKQTNKIENGPWILEETGFDGYKMLRPEDWKDNSVIRNHTIHEFPVLNGILWGGSTVWFTNNSIETEIIGTGDFGTEFDWYHIGGADDVIDTTINKEEVFEYTPLMSNADHRYNCRITGVVTLGDDYVADSFSGFATNIPLDIDPGEDLTDESGADWYTSQYGAAVSLSSLEKYQGTGSWALYREIGHVTATMTRSFIVPANHSARITAYALKGGVTFAQLRCGYGTGSQIGYHNLTTSWTKYQFGITPSTESQNIQLTLHGSNTNTSFGYSAGWIDAIQFAHTLSDFDSRVYIDSEYYPGDGTVTHYPDDEQSTQIYDSSLQFNSPIMIAFAYDANCKITVNQLWIDRRVKLSLKLTPTATVTADPGLPDTLTYVDYPY